MRIYNREREYRARCTPLFSRAYGHLAPKSVRCSPAQEREPYGLDGVELGSRMERE